MERRLEFYVVFSVFSSSAGSFFSSFLRTLRSFLSCFSFSASTGSSLFRVLLSFLIFPGLRGFLGSVWLVFSRVL